MKRKICSRKMGIIFTVFLFTSIVCKGGEMSPHNHPSSLVSETPTTSLQTVGGYKIYFGHQSVGYNILDGVSDILQENPGAALRIFDTRDPNVLLKPAFAHAAVGKNRDPDSKLAEFAAIMDKGIGSVANIAFLKFCYVDITAGTDVGKLFDHYRLTFDHLKKRYPRVTFVHLTVPLTAEQTDMKTVVKNLIKKVIGRPVNSYKDNVARELYNRLLRDTYSGKEPVFDLAVAESTLPDGRRTERTRDGGSYETLAPEYTYDGGHLNGQGRRIVAAQLLNFLATLPIKTR